MAASLRRQNLRAKAARKFKATTNSRHGLPVAPNLLEQDFSATAPNWKWVGDITYLATCEGWLYLEVLIDLYLRKVIGWAMSKRMTADLVGDALQMALWSRKMPKGFIVHSDRGSQYGSSLYQSLLNRHDLRCSMSARSNCYDNACAESFSRSRSTHGRYPRRPARLCWRKAPVGHYWLTGEPEPLNQYIACLDFSSAAGHSRGSDVGKLYAYRWDGEKVLSKDRLVWVKAGGETGKEKGFVIGGMAGGIFNLQIVNCASV